MTVDREQIIAKNPSKSFNSAMQKAEQKVKQAAPKKTAKRNTKIDKACSSRVFDKINALETVGAVTLASPRITIGGTHKHKFAEFHIPWIEDEDGALTCMENPECDLVLADFEDFLEHCAEIIALMPKPKRCCWLCGYSFAGGKPMDRPFYKDHLGKHFPPYLPCGGKNCDLLFRTKIYRFKHWTSSPDCYTPQDNNRGRAPRKNFKNESGVYACVDCDEIFDSAKKLRAHRIMHDIKSTVVEFAQLLGMGTGVFDMLALPEHLKADQSGWNIQEVMDAQDDFEKELSTQFIEDADEDDDILQLAKHQGKLEYDRNEDEVDDDENAMLIARPAKKRRKISSGAH